MGDLEKFNKLPDWQKEKLFNNADSDIGLDRSDFYTRLNEAFPKDLVIGKYIKEKLNDLALRDNSYDSPKYDKFRKLIEAYGKNLGVPDTQFESKYYNSYYDLIYKKGDYDKSLDGYYKEDLTIEASTKPLRVMLATSAASMRGHIVNPHLGQEVLLVYGVPRWDIEALVVRGDKLDWVVKKTMQILAKTDQELAQETPSHYRNKHIFSLSSIKANDLDIEKAALSATIAESRVKLIKTLRLIENLDGTERPINWSQVQKLVSSHASTANLDVSAIYFDPGSDSLSNGIIIGGKVNQTNRLFAAQLELVGPRYSPEVLAEHLGINVLEVLDRLKMSAFDYKRADAYVFAK